MRPDTRPLLIPTDNRSGREARTDIHFHAIPGVDDGPLTIDESVGLMADAARDGTTTIVATPHVRFDHLTDVSELPDLVAEVRARVVRERLPVTILCGAELEHDMVPRLDDADLETIALGPPSARWVLLESPFHGIDSDFHGAAQELRDRGFGVVIAHPERSPHVLEDDRLALRRELEAGSLLQVNSWSLTGDYGPAARSVCASLIEDGLASVLASDAHSRERGPQLSVGMEAAIARGMPSSRLRALTTLNPRTLLERGLVPSRAAGVR